MHVSPVIIPHKISERLRQGKPDIYSTPIKRLEI